MDVEWKKKKGLIGSEARLKRGHSLDVPSFMFFFIIYIYFVSINTETNRMEASGCEEQLCALVPVPQSSRPLLHFTASFTVQKQTLGGQRSFRWGRVVGRGWEGSKGIARTLS